MTTATVASRARKVQSRDQIEQFVEEGFCIVREAFPREDAKDALDMLWSEAKEQAGVDRYDAATWARRHVHVKKGFGDPPFRKIAHSQRFREAIDDVLGEGRYHPVNGLGWWPITFPGFDAKPWTVPDGGWHVDGIQFHHHVNSPDQGLLPIPIFSDIEPGYGGTALSVGSHKVTARVLRDAEPHGLSCQELAKAVTAHPRDNVVEAQGHIGDVALLHPFLLHANGPNCGVAPRIICNPCVRLHEPMRLDRDDPADYSPVEWAIVNALDEG